MKWWKKALIVTGILLFIVAGDVTSLFRAT
jgi:hypothetical protein